ncbi:MAG: GNAT family N-acetyltransferase [Promethearchaeota archaeon]|nr:MAG: GNAT family N-acetyltransferase [Candidatus Lokiarchaeota archaeon]
MKINNYKVFHFTKEIENLEEILHYLNKEPVINFEIIDCLEQLEENPSRFGELIECFVVFKKSDIKIVTFRAPLFNLLISHSNDLGAILPLVEYMKNSNINIPGIYGPSSVVTKFVFHWYVIFKEKFQTSDESWLFLLDKSQIPLKNLGTVKKATIEHEKKLLQWSDAAVLDLIPNSPEIFLESCRINISQRIREKKVYLLEVDDELVSMGAITGESNNMQIINNVYTPPENRCKGYATELCTYMANYIINECNDYPLLSVIITNKPAIHIYQKIGFKKKGKVTLCLK